MSAAPAAREPIPSSDDGLRTALRNVPLLPAPANVDDLLARLDAEAPVSSGPLAELISDARYVEPAPEADDFFAPVARAANANQRPPLARRLLSGLFGAGLLAGSLLIIWNALLKPDPSPPQPAAPAIEAVAAADDHPRAPALPSAVGEPAAEARQGALPPETPAPSAELGELHQPLAAIEPSVLSEPELEPVPPAPDVALQIEALQASALPLIGLSTLSEPELEPVPPAPDVALQIEALHRSMPVAPAEPAALPEPAPLAPAAVAVEITEPASPVGATAAPEPTQEAALQSNEAPASSDSAETMRAAPDAVRDADTARPDEARAPGQVSEPPAASASEPVATADAKADATPALPEPAALPEPVLEVAAAAAAPNPTASIPTESRPALTEHRAAAIETAVAPTPPVPARVRERVPFAGAWAASAEACTPAMQEEGHLVARIGARGGRAGDTGCGFKSIRRRGSTWQIAAACSDGETSWRSDVRLSLSGGRLTWASQRGTTVYVRCPRA